MFFNPLACIRSKIFYLTFDSYFWRMHVRSDTTLLIKKNYWLLKISSYMPNCLNTIIITITIGKYYWCRILGTQYIIYSLEGILLSRSKLIRETFWEKLQQHQTPLKLPFIYVVYCFGFLFSSFLWHRKWKRPFKLQEFILHWKKKD